MRVLDAHVHVLDNYPPMAPFQDLGRVDRLLKLMDEAGVEKALMLPVVAEFSPDNNAECVRWARQHPDRLAAMTDVPLHRPDAAERVRRARDEHGAVAVSCYPATPDLAWLAAAETEPLWAALRETGLPCNLHVSPLNYRHVIAAARRHPEVRIVLNHFGLPKRNGVAPDEPTYGGLAQAVDLPNLFFKVSAFYSVADAPWDCRCPVALAYLYRLRELFGAERLLFGTDWPPAGRHLTYLQIVKIGTTIAQLDDAQRQAILGANAARVFQV